MTNSNHGDSDSRLSSERVIYEVAKTAGTDPLNLPPIYNAIDPDALDSFVGSLEDGQVRFEYAGEQVTVFKDGRIHVASEPDQAEVADDD